MTEKEKKADAYSHIMKYTGLFGGIQMLNVFVGIVRNKLVAMILGPGGMGLLSLFNSTIKLVSDSTNMGIPISGVKTISQNADQGNEALAHSVELIRMWSLVTAIMGFVVCAVFGPFLSTFTFSWGNHSLHYILLSPAIAFAAITGGEMAVLKGTRQLSSLALLSFYYVLMVLAISVPIYYVFGEQGIVPSLVLAAFAQTAITMVYSCRQCPYRVRFNRQLFREGSGMIRLGVAFVLAGILGSGADFLIRSYLNNTGSLDVVGLYNAGYMMTFVYASMVFSSLEADYFPRLSAIKDDVDVQNRCVNQQVEVAVLLISPLLTAFLIAMPILLPLLYSGNFIPVLGMVQVAVLAMFVRAASLPVAYLPLAKGDSLLYLAVEAFYDILIVCLTIAFYRCWGLTGTGLALTLAILLDYIVICVVMRQKYGYRISANVAKYALLQFPFGIAAYAVTFTSSAIAYWGIGTLLILASSMVSVTILRSKTALWQKLTNKLLRR